LDKQLILNTLKKGTKRWNKFRSEILKLKESKDLIDLRGITLENIDLSEADLSQVDLTNARIKSLNLKRAKLTSTCLYNTYFEKTDLSQAELINSDLRLTTFISSVLTGVNLFLTAREEWQLINVECDFIFFGPNSSKRAPSKRNFKKGEFESLETASPSLEIVFEKGLDFIDPMILAFIAEESKENNPDLGLALQSINLRGIHPSVVFKIASDSLSDQAENHIVGERNKLRDDPELFKQMLNTIVNLSETNKQLSMSKERNITIHKGNYYEQTTHYGSVIQADFIESFEKSSSLSKEELTELVNSIAELKYSVIKEIENFRDDSSNSSTKDFKVRKILAENGINILNGVTSSLIFDILKSML
jgi:uncharacterized protein YjbI with pentapeptide repeats